jgi:hypothetical protein
MVACKKHAAVTTGSAETSRPSLRNGLRLIRDLPGAPGFLATIAHDAFASARDTSVGVSGPHDFAVRPDCARPAPPLRPSQPTSTYRDDAYVPLRRGGMRMFSMISEKEE